MPPTGESGERDFAGTLSYLHEVVLNWLDEKSVAGFSTNALHRNRTR
jgi:hypothetical protein